MSAPARPRPSTVRAPITELVVQFGGEGYVGAGLIVAVVPVDRDHRVVYQIRRAKSAKTKLERRWPVAASIRVYSRGINRLFWPQPGFVQAADAELERAAVRQLICGLLDIAWQ